MNRLALLLGCTVLLTCDASRACALTGDTATRPTPATSRPTTSHTSQNPAPKAQTQPGAKRDSGGKPTAAPALTEEEFGKRREHVIELVKDGDPKAWPELRAMLKEPDPRVRQFVIRAVTLKYPEQSFDWLAKLLDDGDDTQREAAGFGLGMVPGGRGAELLLDRLKDGEPPRWLIGGLSIALSQPSIACNNLVLGHAVDVPADFFAPVERIRNALFANFEKPNPATGTAVFQLTSKLLNAEGCARRVQKYLRDAGPDERPVAEAIAALARTNRYWLGRPTARDTKRVRYLFSMSNLATAQPKQKEFELTFTPKQADLLRYRDQDLYRGAKLYLTLDALVSYPDQCGARLQDSQDETTARIQYELHHRERISGGMGSMNISYWQANCFRARRATVVIEKRRQIPVSEQIFDEDGKLLATTKYSQYQSLGDAWTPTRIELTILAPDNLKRRPMHYEYQYRVVDGRVWLFDEGLAYELGQNDERTLLATAHASQVVVEPPATSQPAPKQPK